MCLDALKKVLLIFPLGRYDEGLFCHFNNRIPMPDWIMALVGILRCVNVRGSFEAVKGMVPKKIVVVVCVLRHFCIFRLAAK